MDQLLQQSFYALAAQYTRDTALIRQYWLELQDAYSSEGRHYHNLRHLDHMLDLFEAYRDSWEQAHAVLFALFYHDVVYDPQRQDNEQQSALLAVERLKKLRVPEPVIAACVRHIEATAGHAVSDHNDTNLFTDIDLSILGASWPRYQEYYLQIRREYAVYPDQLYRPGRKKVLQHFLAQPAIYKTKIFRERFEEQARDNLAAELQGY